MTVMRDFTDFIFHVSDDPETILANSVVPILEFHRSLYRKGVTGTDTSTDTIELQARRDSLKEVLYQKQLLNFGDQHGFQSLLVSLFTERSPSHAKSLF